MDDALRCAGPGRRGTETQGERRWSKEVSPRARSIPTSAERKSDREVVIRRVFDAPARLVFEAWTRPELFRQWWVPKSIGLLLLSLDQDVRAGGAYRLVFDLGDSKPMAFLGKYIEVTPHSRLS